ncbi:CCE_0567 family metalloprotein [Kamptonema formosum]|uniref:CCE_0567 family metalloprotein n=1 Tax=Kamptonema formosum TaxID=331992 RepID=UPI000346D8CB|nr:CCE_0567 family metalloprotein [Oscillatoria sp. PCC 10802]
MVKVGESPQSVEDLKTQIKRLNSKGGQLKMELHDLAEGLPADYENIMEVAGRTYELFKQLDEMKKQLKALEQQK